MTLPLLLSVPHAGLAVPPEVADRCLLTPAQIADDGDGGAAAIYGPLQPAVAAFVTTDVARAVVDCNRAPDDRRADGVVKTHTCWDVPVWREPLPDDTVAALLRDHHAPYHARLRALAAAGDVVLGIDCHTMAATAPPVAPDSGAERPLVCLSNGDPAAPTCSPAWFEALAACLESAFGEPVSRNAPFRGGYIVRSHAGELPWIQLELSRTERLDHNAKRAAILAALTAWSAWNEYGV